MNSSAKTFAGVLAGLLITLGGASAASIPAVETLHAPEKTITLNYYGGAIPAARANKIIAEFEKRYPTIKISYHAVPFNSYNETLGARFAQGDVDIFDIDQPQSASYAVRGWEADLTAAFANQRALIDPPALQESTINGKLLNLPYQIGTTFLYYNKKVLQQIGVAFPSNKAGEIPTWEWVEATAHKAVASKATAYGVTFSTPDMYYYLQPLAESLGAGSGVIGEKQLTPDINNPGWIQALSWYGKLYAEGLAPRGVRETALAFANGDSAFFYGGIWNSPTIIKNANLDFGITSAPRFKEGKAATTSGGWALGISALASEEKQQAAALFLNWYLFGENGGFVSADPETENVPTTEATRAVFWKNPAYADPRLAGLQAILTWQAQHAARIRPQTVGGAEFTQLVGAAIADIINGADAKKTLDSTNARLKTAWRKYQ
ncbi:Putative extracellular solute-binding protein family 1 [Sodalis praecaptivus]|uniref:Putative extracellular solute-binding protein family 1 n=1 Tax=Sodalis praecaptivus TaxID=1239307 RepID=W0HYH5_9GAMM|nr:extracellular solute-binding protein [Sodalis praecaptivus]AHF77265.1 Putative extracellular solute-binding protein family 1 [Sodalis praecaptivus]